MAERAIPGSFRDPSGFLFLRKGVLFRQINQPYLHHYEKLLGSGLYESLAGRGWLVRHSDVERGSKPGRQKIIQPDLIPFISYPYEWSFSQLKDAALLTLAIQRLALEHGMSLKDCSAYNIQFQNGRPTLIDTLSFEIYTQGLPWVAYRQFCKHFLAPLALMALTDIRLNQLLRIHLDGIPLDLASRLLPRRTRFGFSLAAHIHLQARFERKYQHTPTAKTGRKVSKMALLGLVDSLESAINKLHWAPGGTEWGEYYAITNYSEAAFADKRAAVEKMVKKAKPRTVWDLGANTGVFSRIAAAHAELTVSFDSDPAAVEKNYLQCKENPAGEKLLPLLMDLTNPSPGIGWDNEERMALKNRGPVEMVLALALVHHLAISNNVPLGRVAEFFAGLCQTLLIEFVPKEDSQVQKLLASREDVFAGYHREGFEAAFGEKFEISEKKEIAQTVRTLYLLRKKG